MEIVIIHIIKEIWRLVWLVMNNIHRNFQKILTILYGHNSRLYHYPEKRENEFVDVAMPSNPNEHIIARFVVDVLSRWIVSFYFHFVGDT